MTVLPWWAAGAALAVTAVGHWIVERRPLGVSGVVARFANVRGELRAEREASRAPTGAEALAAALAEATAEAIAGGELVAAAPSSPAASTAAPATPPGRAPRALGPPAPLLGHAAFLAGLAAGGLLVRLAGARLDAAGALAGHAGAGSLAVLAAGGLLLGFGGAWMGGCTTGHGITGCARLMPGSLLATAVFLATAALVASVLGGARS